MKSTEVDRLELIVHFNTIIQFPILSNIVLSKTADYSSTKPKQVEHMKDALNGSMFIVLQHQCCIYVV